MEEKQLIYVKIGKFERTIDYDSFVCNKYMYECVQALRDYIKIYGSLVIFVEHIKGELYFHVTEITEHRIKINSVCYHDKVSQNFKSYHPNSFNEYIGILSIFHPSYYKRCICMPYTIIYKKIYKYYKIKEMLYYDSFYRGE